MYILLYITSTRWKEIFQYRFVYATSFHFSWWQWPISSNFIKLGFRSELPLPPLPLLEDRKSGSFAA